MKITTKLLATCAALGLLAIATAAQADYVIVDRPDAAYTDFNGIDGDYIVGYSSMNSEGHGFIYNKSMAQSDPGAWQDVFVAGSTFTVASGISGNSVVGYYRSGNARYSFIYDKSKVTDAYSQLSFVGGPTNSVSDICASSIDGNFIVGSYNSTTNGSTTTLGFVFNTSDNSWFSLDTAIFGGIYTSAVDIDGNNILVNYADDVGFWYSSVYDMGVPTSWTDMNVTGAPNTALYGIDGGSYAGEITDAEGNYGGGIYDGTTWTALNPAGSTYTCANGIDNGNVVGYFNDSVGTEEHGFIYTSGGSAVPEPATLLGFGVPMLMVGLGKLRGLRK